MIRQVLTAREAVEKALVQVPGKGQRQIGAVGTRGNAYGFTGVECPEHAGHAVGSDFVASGNILAVRRLSRLWPGLLRRRGGAGG